MKDLSSEITKILNYELKKRKEVNPQYSLRSFANYLDIDSSTLSKVLRGERRMGLEYQKRCLQRLKLKEADFIADESISQPEKEYLDLESDQFKVLSSWHYLAISELLKVEPYKSDWTLLADRFGLQQEEVKSALSVLQTTGFIDFNEDSIEVSLRDLSCVTLSTTGLARKEYLKSIFTKSIEAINDVSFEERDHSALTVLANRNQIKKIKQEVTKFRRKIDAILEAEEGKQDVYHLAIGFSPATNNIGEMI